MQRLDHVTHPIVSSESTDLPHDPHQQVLQNALPAWLGQASPAKRTALRRAGAGLAGWYASARPREHDTLKALVTQAWTTQNQVDRAMSNLQSPADFGAPLLQQALKQRFGIERDVRSTYLRLYVPLTIPWFPLRTGAVRAWTVSLLDAALHNFEDHETRRDAYEVQSGFITRPTRTGQFDSLPGVDTRISVPQFTALCRELDIGGQYQRYLEQYLDLKNPVATAYSKHLFSASQAAALKTALQMARMKKDPLDASSFALLQRLFNTQGRTNACLPLLCYELRIMSSRLTGIVLFAENLERSHTQVPVIAHIPDDPDTPLKQYPSSVAFMTALGNKLRSADYQQFFSRFIDDEERGYFFANLNRRLSQVTWHPHTRGDPGPSWRDTPIEKPNLQFSATRINRDLFEHLYQTRLSKLFNDARTQAVSTASADQKARWERWNVLQQIGSTLLQIAAFIAAPFVPPVGLLMLGYTAYQLLDDTFEGIIDWAQGLRTEAFEHLMSAVEQLLQLGLFAAGAPLAETVLRQVLPGEFWQFIDRLKPVTRPDGQARLWHPDLSPYAHELELPKQARPTPQGLHSHNGKTVLPLAGKHFVVEDDPVTGQPYLHHPTRPDAYRPTLMSNGKGAWLTELDRPLSWDKTTLMRRLGHQTAQLSDRQLVDILRISATDEGALRKMHLTQGTPPPLLADTLERFKIDQALQDFIDQMNSDDPAVYGLANSQTQLQLLTNLGLWPKSRTLRFLDAQGKTLWEFTGEEQASVVQIHEAQLKNGDLLKALLEALDEPQRKTLLGDNFGDPVTSLPTRALTLRKKLAGLAQAHRHSLFESRYLGLNRTRDPRAQQLMDNVSGLPASAAEALLDSASGEELRQIDHGTLPARLVQWARRLYDETQINRAYEGLRLDSVDHPDTTRLALHSLQKLPGWNAKVRLEIKSAAPESKRLDSIGKPKARLHRTLVRSPEGRYTPQDSTGPLFAETDLYTAILQAIPDAERNALGLQIGQGPQLKQALNEHALERPALQKLITSKPAPPRGDNREHLRLLGMDGYRPAPPAGPSRPATLEEQAQALFPSHTHEQIVERVRDLENRPGGAHPALAALRQEYQQLDRDLAAWEANTPRLHPGTEVHVSRQEYYYRRRNRALWAQELRRCWRQETEVDNYFDPPNRNGQVLKLLEPICGELPPLRLRFQHISLLAIEGNRTPLNVDGFLRLFPRLRHLNIRTVQLTQLPATLGSLANLNELILSDCSVTLTPDSLRTLSTLTRLKTLDLFRNPLRLVPSVESMPDMRFLDLSHTSIPTLPAGLLSRPRLELALLSNNQLTELPSALFERPDDTRTQLDLSGNPLSRATLQQVKRYFQRTGQCWDIDAERADIDQVNRLFPTFSEDETNRLIFGLPGNLEAGKVELAKLETEYQDLDRDLESWVLQTASLEEQGPRRAFKTSLLKCWRRETDPDEANPSSYTFEHSQPLSGEFPTFNSTFSHVSSLRLQGVGGAFPLRPAPFLKGFPALRRLSVEGYVLGDIPESLLEIPQLSSLTLTHTSITLSSDAAATLATLDNLQHLDLSHNPLGRLPDLGRLARLSDLNLEGTGLDEIPANLLTPVERKRVNLSNNRITQLPASLFRLPTTVTNAFDLSDNPLSKPALLQIKHYCQRTSEHFKATAPHAQRDRITALYPSFVETEASRFYFELPGDLDAVEPTLARLEAEYEKLTADLQAWILDIPARHPILDVPLDEQTRAQDQLNRQAFTRTLEEAWRRESEVDEDNDGSETTHKIEFARSLIGELPDLSARFKHVSCLELDGEGSTLNANGVLRCFPRLRTLIISKYRLGDIPPAVFDMPRLITLGLSESAIRLTPASADGLSGLQTLTNLDLSDNPLGMAPDVSLLRNLESLYLQDTAITEVPPGLFSLTELNTLDLSDNLISEIPAAILELPTQLNDLSDLSGNPLSPQSLEHLRQYYLRTGENLGIREAMLDAQGNPLTRQEQPEPMEE
jgi:Leucine-rich repeat (LRR) protein